MASANVVRGWRRVVLALTFAVVVVLGLSALRIVLRTLSVHLGEISSRSSPSPPPPAVERRAAEIDKPRALVDCEGVVQPGLTVTLSAAGSTGSDLWYRWIQTEGTPIVFDQPTARETTFVIPAGATALGFVLVVGNPAGVDTAALTLPVERKSKTQTPPTPVPPQPAPIHNVPIQPAPTPSVPTQPVPTADAGSDQQGTVGQLVTLTGNRGVAREGFGHRWLQVGGPPVRLKLEDRLRYTFVPEVAGTYQFALVVASGTEISEPSVTTVTVNERPLSTTAGPIVPPARTEPLTELARSGLATVEGGPAAADGLAQTFEAVAERMALYHNYSEAFQEVSRRLNTIVPADPARRAGWFDRLFTPLSARLIESLRADGLDLSRLEGQEAPLTPAQRDRIASQFRAIAAGFRPVSLTLPPTSHQ